MAVLVVVGMLTYLIHVNATLRSLQSEWAFKADKTAETHKNAAIKVDGEPLKQFPKPAAVQEVAQLGPLQKAAQQGDASAQDSLGLRIYNHPNDSNDYAKAVELFRKASVQGFAPAQYHLGIMYANGVGVPKDTAKAVEWYKKAANQGNEDAISTLARFYNYSTGTPKDETKPSFFTNPTAAAAGRTPKPDDALLRHLATDVRLASGSLLVDRLRHYSGKGKLTLENGLEEDAYVKVIRNEKLVAAFYVQSHGKFTYSTIPDGSYAVAYCTGYGWDGTVRNFARGRHAHRYDAPLGYSTNQARDASGVTTYTDVVTLTLHKVANGNATTSDMSLEDFDRY